MSINATTNYMSASTIDEWMEQKTEGLYRNMGSAMDVSNERASAEQELNHIKDMLADAKNQGGDVTEVSDEINQALVAFKDVPELVQALGAIAHGISEAGDSSSTPGVATSGKVIQAGTPASVVKAASGDIDNWCNSIGHTVDALGKTDQLGLINIQEFNSQINQAKQVASALMDAADKAASAVISHIS